MIIIILSQKKKHKKISELRELLASLYLFFTCKAKTLFFDFILIIFSFQIVLGIVNEILPICYAQTSMIIFDLNMMIMVMIWLTLIHTYTLVKQVFIVWILQRCLMMIESDFRILYDLFIFFSQYYCTRFSLI